MKIQSKNDSVKSMKLIVPIDGMIVIDENGMTDVSENCAEILVTMTNDWEYVEEKEKKHSTKETEEKEVTDSEEEENDANGEETDSEDENSESEEDEEGTVSVDELRKLTYKQLRETASEAGFPEEEWGKLKKELLVQYLMKKMSE